MEFAFDYVLNHYGHCNCGVDYIHYPAVSPKRLLVTFASLNEGKHYQRIRQFWSPNETWQDTSFLFFRDKENAWYENINPILSIIRSLDVPRIFTSGSCMGAYGALMAGLQLPAFGMLLTVTRCPGDVKPLALELAMQQCITLPKCYIEARGTWIDQEMLMYVTDSYRNQGGLCLFRSMPESKEHWAVDLWKVPFTMRLVNALENWTLEC